MALGKDNTFSVCPDQNRKRNLRAFGELLAKERKKKERVED
jgi:hypothetical protein